MRKNEKVIYKSGKDNPNGFRFKRFRFFKRKSTVVIFHLFLAFSFVISFLNFTGILTWNKLFSTIGIVEGVKQQDSNFSVYFLDVGQSDCTVIVCDDEVMLIDSGTVNQVHNIRESLYSLEIKEIDYLFVTHQHDDHMAGASKLIDEYKINNIFMPKLSSINFVDSLTYQDLINKIAINNINPFAVSCGDIFHVGSASVRVLAPMKQDENLNNMSLVLKVTYGETSFLFQGDSEEKVEKQIMSSGANIKADVIKIGHHGSNTSTSESYLQAVNPQYAIISAGIDNSYGHPSTPIIRRLVNNDVQIFLTSYHGDITISSDGKNISVIKQREGKFFS